MTDEKITITKTGNVGPSITGPEWEAALAVAPELRFLGFQGWNEAEGDPMCSHLIVLADRGPHRLWAFVCNVAAARAGTTSQDPRLRRCPECVAVAARILERSRQAAIAGGAENRAARRRRREP